MVYYYLECASKFLHNTRMVILMVLTKYTLNRMHNSSQFSETNSSSSIFQLEFRGTNCQLASYQATSAEAGTKIGDSWGVFQRGWSDSSSHVQYVENPFAFYEMLASYLSSVFCCVMLGYLLILQHASSWGVIMGAE